MTSRIPCDHPLDEAALHAYLDGELPLEARAALESHARTCDDCARRLDEARALLAAVDALPGVLPDTRPSRDLAPGVLAAIGHDRSANGLVRWLLLPEILLTLGLMLIAVPAVVAASSAVLPLAAWRASMESGLASSSRAVVEQWSALAAALAGGPGLAHAAAGALRGPLWPTPSVLSALSSPTWIGLVVGVTLVWLLGNGALLGTPRAFARRGSDA